MLGRVRRENMKIQINEKSIMKFHDINISKNNANRNNIDNKTLYDVPLKDASIIYDSKDGVVLKKNQSNSIPEEIEDINIAKK
jgi:hypothetical protein